MILRAKITIYRPRVACWAVFPCIWVHGSQRTCHRVVQTSV